MTSLSALPSTVSVAIAGYNGERFLNALLDSILVQTVAPDELVFQDDRSSDATVAMIEGFAAQAPFPVRLSINEDRLRPAGNFGRCIERCVGDIIILSDQDDVWEPDRVARTIEAYRDPTVSYTFSDAPLIDQSGVFLGRTIFDTVPMIAADHRRLATGDDLLPLMLRYGVLYGTTLSIRRDMAHIALPVPAGWSHDDWLTHIGAAGGKSRRLAPVTQYRQHADQVVGAGVAGVQAILIGARDRTTDFYAIEQRRYEAALSVLPREGEIAAILRPVFEAKLAFIIARRKVHQGGFTGFGHLTRLISQGDYSRFAAGGRSVAKDTMMTIRSSIGFSDIQ